MIHYAVADPDLQIKGGGGSHPDPEIKGGGGLQKKIFGPSNRASVWSKTKGEVWAPRRGPYPGSATAIVEACILP